MISRETIDNVNDLSLVTVISKYIDLKKSGSTYKANSPFSTDKTASFMVSDSKRIYKCFSSGIGGKSPISFVMDKLKLSYPKAIEELANKFNITIKFNDSLEAKKYFEHRQKQQSIIQVNDMAANFFVKQLKETETKNRLSIEANEKYNLGYAPSGHKLKDYLIEKGFSTGSVKNAELLSSKSTHDYFQHRIMFPITDWELQVIGFGGGSVGYKKEDKFPKYLNSKATKVYDKSTVFYGINQEAKDAIHKKSKVILVEGYYDVIAMQECIYKEVTEEGGIESYSTPFKNTLSPCGTSFTEKQAEILKKKNVTTVLFVFDGDAPGIKALSRAIPICVELGLFVELCILPNGEDPDSYKHKGDLAKYIFDNIIDGYEWIGERFFDGANTIAEKHTSKQNLENFLATIPKESLRNTYIVAICKKLKLISSDVKKETVNIVKLERQSQVKERKSKIPDGGKREDLESYGFVEVYKHMEKETGYWFADSGGNFTQLSNFIIEPIVHLLSKTNNKRLIRIKNYKKQAIIDVPSKDLVTLGKFEEAIGDEGNFLFDGSKPHFQKIKHKIFDEMPVCHPITNLGWQRDGFYAFANGIIEEKFKKIDADGIVSFGEDLYFLPAYSAIYKDVKEDDDLYESDRFFSYHGSDVTFEEWNKLFVEVFGNHGVISTAFIIATIFRDVIFKIFDVFPLWFGMGQKGTGKSYLARAICAFFFQNQQPFNLHSGTNVGFTRSLAKVRNAPVWVDEYNNEIDDKIFQGLKRVFDGSGHTKGVMSNDNRVVTTKVEASCLSTGQYHPTRDGNSLFSRTIYLVFEKQAQDYTSEEKQKAVELSNVEDKGLSHLLEQVVKYRELIESKIHKTTHTIKEELSADLDKIDAVIDGRILQNYALILAPVHILKDIIPFQFTYEDLYNVSKKSIVDVSEMVVESDQLAQFIQMIEYLQTEKQIHLNYDFIVEENKTQIKVRKNRKEMRTVSFDKPKTLLFLQFTKIYPLYMKNHKLIYSSNGLDKTSLQSYIHSHKSFIGNVATKRFEGKKTSAYVFDYETFGANLLGHRKEKKQEQPQAVNDDFESVSDVPFPEN